MAKDNSDILDDTNLDRVEEYFKTKGILKTLRGEMKDIKSQMEEFIEMEKIGKKARELREKLKADETIHEMSEKIGSLKERMDLLREMIRIDLMETGKEEVKRDGRKLKLQYVLKEGKDTEALPKK